MCFTKQDLQAQWSLPVETLNSRIRRALKSRALLQLKNGLYMMRETYIHELNKEKLSEMITAKIRDPSYLSLEYVLEKHHVLPQRSSPSLTCVTTRMSRTFKNFMGTFAYSNIKPSCFFGFHEVPFQGEIYAIATKAKALFDYFYLDSHLDYRNVKRLRVQLFKASAIQWQNFSEEDFKEFEQHVWKSNSFKMMKVRRILEDHFSKKKFDVWAKNLFL